MMNLVELGIGGRLFRHKRVDLGVGRADHDIRINAAFGRRVMPLSKLAFDRPDGRARRSPPMLDASPARSRFPDWPGVDRGVVSLFSRLQNEPNFMRGVFATTKAHRCHVEIRSQVNGTPVSLLAFQIEVGAGKLSNVPARAGRRARGCVFLAQCLNGLREEIVNILEVATQNLLLHRTLPFGLSDFNAIASSRFQGTSGPDYKVVGYAVGASDDLFFDLQNEPNLCGAVVSRPH
jgi:hypothetical protein